jgi:hypothetical protein
VARPAPPGPSTLYADRGIGTTMIPLRIYSAPKIPGSRCGGAIEMLSERRIIWQVTATAYEPWNLQGDDLW